STREKTMNAMYRKHAVALAVAAVIAAPAAYAGSPGPRGPEVNAEINLSYTDTHVHDKADWERTSHDSATVERHYTETSDINHQTTVNSDTDITYNHVANTDVRTEVNEHDVGVRLRKDL